MRSLNQKVIIFVGCVLAVGISAYGWFWYQNRFEQGSRWWKGNMHTQSLWSGYGEFPEVLLDWYKKHDYNFIVWSDRHLHDDKNKWISTNDMLDGWGKPRDGLKVLVDYMEQFTPKWVTVREKEGIYFVKLKRLEEYRKLSEERDRFLIVPGLEISANSNKWKIHTCAMNVQSYIAPQVLTTASETIAANMRNVLEQKKSTGTPMMVHLPHPNAGWWIKAENFWDNDDVRFFEVYNGSHWGANRGNKNHPSSDDMWDQVLAHRLSQPNGQILYGIAADDAYVIGGDMAPPGRGWVEVRASTLSTKALVEAMDKGDFYASTGVKLTDIQFDGRKLSIEIDPEDGVQYRTEFRGTRRDLANVGETFSTEEGLEPFYSIKGDELYVRAKVFSSKPKPDAPEKGEVEVGWTQPYLVKNISG